LRQSDNRLGRITPIGDGVSSYKPVQTSKPVPSTSHAQNNYAEQFVPISSGRQVGSLPKQSVGQRSLQSRPQSANAKGKYLVKKSWNIESYCVYSHCTIFIVKDGQYSLHALWQCKYLNVCVHSSAIFVNDNENDCSSLTITITIDF